MTYSIDFIPLVRLLSFRRVGIFFKYKTDMPNWNTLKNAVANVIKANNNKEITGPLLQNVLHSIINAVGENAAFAGIANVETNPGFFDGPVFFLASEPGIYSNFSGLVLPANTIGVFLYNNQKWSLLPIIENIVTLSDISKKANLNSQNALATGEEQRLVIKIIPHSEKPVIVASSGTYFNENTNKIETWVVEKSGSVDTIKLVLSEAPSENVIYCDADTNTLLRWNNNAMVTIMGGTPVTEETYSKPEIDKMLRGKINKAGDNVEGSLVFSNGEGVAFSDESGEESYLYQDEEDRGPRMQSKTGDRFIFQRDLAPKNGSNALVISEDLYRATATILNSMGVELDNADNTGDSLIMYIANIGDFYYDANNKHLHYQNPSNVAVDLGAPSSKRLYVNINTGLIYRWSGDKWVILGRKPIDAYTKKESDAKYAKLKDPSQSISAYNVAGNIVVAKNLWLNDDDGDGININKAGNRLNIEGDIIITDAEIAQTTGAAADKIMSQKATTEALENIKSDVIKITPYLFLRKSIVFSNSGSYILDDADVPSMQKLVQELINNKTKPIEQPIEAVFVAGSFENPLPDGLTIGEFTIRSIAAYIDLDVQKLHFIFCVFGINYHLESINTVNATTTKYEFSISEFTP